MRRERTGKLVVNNRMLEEAGLVTRHYPEPHRSELIAEAAKADVSVSVLLARRVDTRPERQADVSRRQSETDSGKVKVRAAGRLLRGRAHAHAHALHAATQRLGSLYLTPRVP